MNFGSIDGETDESNRGFKRNRGLIASDTKVEDILNQSKLLKLHCFSFLMNFLVCSKMDKLSTSEQSNDDKVAAFMEVLSCSASDAQFFLESSNWNIEIAVVLWLDNNTSSYNPHANGNRNHHHSYSRKNAWIERDIIIDGLNPDWAASVDPSSGRVIFTHIPTGHQQPIVPPGFADSIDSSALTIATEAETNISKLLTPSSDFQDDFILNGEDSINNNQFDVQSTDNNYNSSRSVSSNTNVNSSEDMEEEANGEVASQLESQDSDML